MYLARIRKNNRTHYAIRQSYRQGDCYKSRELFDLGPDPSRFIIYPGGNAYYLDPMIQEVLDQSGVEYRQEQLDALFFKFLDPEIQRVITGFDRRYRRPYKGSKAPAHPLEPVHQFDKRRLHYLRWGHSRQRFLNQVPEKYFDRLRAKSRDELEQYFMAQEADLRYQELPVYVATIFSLNLFVPDGDKDQSIQLQRDAFFIDQLCRLHADTTFWTGMSPPATLRDYLARYAITYFDAGPPLSKPAWLEHLEAFINNHRSYIPPAKVRVRLEQAAKLFGKSWKELKTMDRASLTRLYRRLALKHHPDQGGHGDTFMELTRIYQVLLKRKPNKKS